MFFFVGTFHCDELLAVYLLQKLPQFKDHALIRTRDQELLDQCDIVVDVGSVFDPSKQRFDHHQVSSFSILKSSHFNHVFQSTFKETLSTLRPDLSETSGIRLSSAGLIYVHYGELIISEILKNEFATELTDAQLVAVFKKIYSSFIQGEQNLMILV